jgi:hypothetical protein
LAIAATVVLSLSGVLLLLGASIWAPVAVVGAAISLSLIFVTFNPWLIVGVVINVGIILDVLVWHVPATAFP